MNNWILLYKMWYLKLRKSYLLETNINLRPDTWRTSLNQEDGLNKFSHLSRLLPLKWEWVHIHVGWPWKILQQSLKGSSLKMPEG